MQRIGDKQKTLARHGALLSDKRLPLELLDYKSFQSVEGRVLGHGEDEQSGRRYLMLEGIDAKVHFIDYTSEMEEARSRGGLKTNSFLRLRKRFVNAHAELEIADFGNAEAFLKNKGYLQQAARNWIKRGRIPLEDGWGGWLGKYQAAVRRAAVAELQSREERTRTRARDRSQGR